MITFLGDVALTEETLQSDYKPTYPYVFNLEYAICSHEDFPPKQGKINDTQNG